MRRFATGLVVGLLLTFAPASAGPGRQVIHLERGDVVRVVSHSRAACVYVWNSTVHDAHPKVTTKVRARPCPPHVDPDVVQRPPGAER